MNLINLSSKISPLYISSIVYLLLSLTNLINFLYLLSVVSAKKNNLGVTINLNKFK